MMLESDVSLEIRELRAGSYLALQALARGLVPATAANVVFPRLRECPQVAQLGLAEPTDS